jgi:hypothetical protein
MPVQFGNQPKCWTAVAAPPLPADGAHKAGREAAGAVGTHVVPASGLRQFGDEGL